MRLQLGDHRVGVEGVPQPGKSGVQVRAAQGVDPCRQRGDRGLLRFGRRTSDLRGFRPPVAPAVASVGAPLGHEAVVGAFLEHPAFVDDEDLVGGPDEAGVVGDDHRRLALHQ